jgi:pimeloyl-ACP methyl ester carboxylesterase
VSDAIVHGVRLHVQRLGEPSSRARVVFVHGLVMDNLASWYFTVANAVASFADVLLYDVRGHGMSEMPKSGYGVSDLATELHGVIDAVLGAEPVVVVGNSFGALLALEFARRFPERARGLVLVDGHLGAEGFGEQMARTLSLRGEDAYRAIAATFKDWLGRHSARKRTRLADHARALVETTTLVADLRATPPLAPSDLARIATPTLALYGEKSDIVDESAKLLRAMPRCTLEILAGCTHSILWEATDTVRARVVDFCRAHAEGGA